MSQPDEYGRLVGFKLRRAIRRRHLYHHQVAHLAGISTNGLARILNGHNVRLSTLRKISSVLEIDLSELLKTDPPEPRHIV